MQKEIVESYRDTKVAVYVVWLPMIATDSEEAARRSAMMYGDPRVRQFYDPDRMSGIAFTRETSPAVQRALTSLPAGPLRARFEEWLRHPPEERPMWDIVYFFPETAAWTDALPQPRTWSKQVSFYPPRDGSQATGLFFKDDPSRPPVESDWFLEVRSAMRVMRETTGASN